MYGFDGQKHHVDHDEQKVQGRIPFAFANPGSGEMTLNMQSGKQRPHPQFQVGAELFQRRFDLPLKESTFFVMQSKAPFFVVFVNHLEMLTCHRLGAFSIVIFNYLTTLNIFPPILGAKDE
jgi:hypothetical protein